LAPVVESFSSQITDWLDYRNVKFALNMESLGKLNSGEICFAAILDRQEGQSDAASHAIVVMVDIQGHEADYDRLMAEVKDDLTQRGAKSVELSILDQKVTRWEFEKPRGIAVALLHPGYVKTRMVNFGGHISPQESATGIAACIKALNVENSGGFWHSNGEQLPW
jgi:hypothetical protein